MPASLKTGDQLGNLIKNKDLFMKAQSNKTTTGIKQLDWFKQLQEATSDQVNHIPEVPQKRLKNGLTLDQEIQIGLDMIPMFKKTEEEAQCEYDKIMEVKQRLNQIRDEHHISKPRSVKPLATTSFMVRKNSQQRKAHDSSLKKLESRKEEDTLKPKELAVPSTKLYSNDTQSKIHEKRPLARSLPYSHVRRQQEQIAFKPSDVKNLKSAMETLKQSSIDNTQVLKTEQARNLESSFIKNKDLQLELNLKPQPKTKLESK